MKDFISRLSSRKFLLTVGIVVTACANHQYTAAAAAGLGYLASEGIIDARAINTAGQVETRAHALATQLLQELSQLPAQEPAPPEAGSPLKGGRARARR